MKSFATLFLMLAFNTIPALADQPITHVDVSGSTTSDGIHDRSLIASWRNHRRDLFWPLPEEADRAWDVETRAELHQGDDQQGHYRGQRFALGMGRKFSPTWLLDALLGFHAVSEDINYTTKVIPTGDVALYFAPATQLNVTARYGHDFVYQDLVQPGGLSNHLTADSLWLDLVPRPVDAWRFPIRSSVRRFSDANTRRNVDASVLYGLAMSELWVWAGLGAEYLSYTTTQTSYWSPSRFLAMGPRLEAVVPVYRSFRAAASVNLNRFQENQFAWGWGYYTTARLELGNREGWLGSVGYTRIRSSQGGTQWFSNGLTLSLSAQL